MSRAETDALLRGGGCAASRGWRRGSQRLRVEKVVSPGFLRGRRRGYLMGGEVSGKRADAKSLRLCKRSPGPCAGVDAGELLSDLQRVAVAFGLGGMRHA